MRSRRDRRRHERAQRALVRDLERLAALSPGGSPERPIDTSSPAAIEPAVARSPCPLCGGAMRLVDHRVWSHPTESLREAVAHCAHCGIERSIYFRLRLRAPH